jgi:hypothetical protein
VAEEEDRRRRRGHGDSAEDGAEPEGEVTRRRRLLWMTQLLTSVGPFRRRARGRPT